MTPTMYMRFIERVETVEKDGDCSVSRKVKVLQQFWETPTGSEIMSDAFIRLYGTWRDVPLIKD